MDIIKTLQDYEKAGLLFHGSPKKLDVIEPKKPFDSVRSGGFNNDTALFATPHVVIAVAFACVDVGIINRSDRQKFGTKYGVYFVKDVAELRIPSYFKNYFNRFNGYVYVIGEKPNDNNWQVKLYKPHKPLDCIYVNIGLFECLGGRTVWLG